MKLDHVPAATTAVEQAFVPPLVPWLASLVYQAAGTRYVGAVIGQCAIGALAAAFGWQGTLTQMGWFFTKAALLTFGGAYTAIPFLQRDAVQVGQWLSNAQFLDGLALSGLLPAPLIIFSTFVGYIGGGPLGGIIITIGVFAPAFAFTMIGHDYLERIIDNKSAQAFLDGVTAGVVGLISATALGILGDTLTDIHAWVIFGMALVGLFASKSKWIVAVVVLAGGLYGIIFL